MTDKRQTWKCPACGKESLGVNVADPELRRPWCDCNPAAPYRMVTDALDDLFPPAKPTSTERPFCPFRNELDVRSPFLP